MKISFPSAMWTRPLALSAFWCVTRVLDRKVNYGPVPPKTHSRFGSPAQPRVPRLGHCVHRGVSALIAYNGVSPSASGYRGLDGVPR